ncbi:MAG: hypothetical protein KME03_14390 [Aphanocapsa lilacina HA4352-LM1]|nr:hypothetical protein [Aphanocapsa lilacina HA4352-LM1]
MAAPAPLKGSELIDCAKANAGLGMAVACTRSGYGRDEALFLSELRKACGAIGIDLTSFDQLASDSGANPAIEGAVVAPESQDEL